MNISAVRFKDIEVGSYGLFGVCPFIKISDEYDYHKGMSKNKPNAFMLGNFHYATINPKATILLVKKPSDFY